MTHPLADNMYDHDDEQGQALAKQEQDEMTTENQQIQALMQMLYDFGVSSAEYESYIKEQNEVRG